MEMNRTMEEKPGVSMNERKETQSLTRCKLLILSYFHAFASLLKESGSSA